ncbi:hypothetical protein [Nitrobacter sp. TKz-YC02]|uniref:hypothetical protein n=1 Tax=Nitrobacter sp. TKz-YC02 TaxID=3398704 RepID=UPI003CFB1A09
MTFPNENEPPRGTRDERRINTTRWAIAGAVVLVLFGLLLIYPGRKTHDKSAENPPSPATQSQPQK